jgi:hypothetical protein
VKGDLGKVRQSYIAALSALGDSPSSTAVRAYVLADLIPKEYVSRDCENAGADLLSFAKMIDSPEVPPQTKAQLVLSLKAAVGGLGVQSCPDVSKKLDTIVRSTQTSP